MQRRPLSRLNRPAALLGCALLGCALLSLGHAQGAELGEVSLHSFIGQPLLADIELTALTPDEAAALQVRLASPDVYRGASIGMNPALATLQLALMRHDDQRQFVHISSLQAVDAHHVNLFLMLGAGGRLAVRGVTLWLVADPHPAAPPVLPPVPPPVAPPLPVQHLQAVASVPALPPAAALAAHPHGMPAAWSARLRAQPAARPEHACSPQTGEQAQACAALDVKNAALNSKIADLEGKVKVLQGALTAPVAAAAAPPVQASKRPKDKQADAPSTLIYWLAAAAALLAIGAGSYLFWRRKKAKTPFKPSRYWVLLRSPFTRKARK